MTASSFATGLMPSSVSQAPLLTDRNSLVMIQGHYNLWSNGAQHTDPSFGNLMVRFNSDAGTSFGVLNDWDLGDTSVANGEKMIIGRRERTGVIQFMALELLTEKYWTGKAYRQYRHDLEGLIWILPWVCLQYKPGKKKRGSSLQHWSTADYAQAHQAKTAFLEEFVGLRPKHFKLDWMLAFEILKWIRRLQHQAFDAEERQYKKLRASGKGDEGSDVQEDSGPTKEECWEGFWRVVRDFLNSEEAQKPNIAAHFAFLRGLIPNEIN